jgi:hypothetical protein
MSRHQKLVDRLSAVPSPRDFRFADLVALLSGFGFILREHGGGSSHKSFIHQRAQGGEYRIVCARPHPGGVLKVYQVREICARLRQWGFL